MTDQELDARFAALRDVDPPAAVQAATLAAVRRERRRPEGVPRSGKGEACLPLNNGSAGRPHKGPFGMRATRALWLRFAAVTALAAGVALAVGVERDEVGDPARMVARGAGEVTPLLALSAAVQGPGGVARLSSEGRYSPGDTLLFRLVTSTPMDITLTRNGVVVYQGAVVAGTTDLPVAYRFEAGEGAAVFRVEGQGVRAEVQVPAVSP